MALPKDVDRAIYRSDPTHELLRHFMRMQEKLIDAVCQPPLVVAQPGPADVKFKHVFDPTIGESDAERDYRRSTDTLAALKRMDEKDRKLDEIEKDVDEAEPLTKLERSRILHRRMLSRHDQRIMKLEKRARDLEGAITQSAENRD